MHSREGVGDVKAWPSAASEQGPKTLNISMTSPFGHAQFEASAAAFEAFLARTYELVPDGDESAYMNFDAKLTELLSHALAHQAPADGGGITGGTIASIRCGPGSA